MVVLFILAVLLAWPTSGLSVIAFVALAVFKSYLNAKSRIHYSNKRFAERAMSTGEQKVPSWVEDRNENEIFISVIQQRAMRKGVPQVFLQAVLADRDTLEKLVHYAGAMEHQGASFIEQQVAVADRLVEIWGNSPTEIKEAALYQ